MKKRPDFITDEHLKYLDDLRESGDTNMWGQDLILLKPFLNCPNKSKGNC